MTYRRSQSTSRAERSNHPDARRSSVRRERDAPRSGSTSRRRSSVHDHDDRDDPLRRSRPSSRPSSSRQREHDHDDRDDPLPLRRSRPSSRPSPSRRRERQRSPRQTDRSPVRRLRDDRRGQQQLPRTNSDAVRHQARPHNSSRSQSSRRKTIDVPIESRSSSRRSDNVNCSDKHWSAHRQRPHERRTSEDKVQRIMMQIKNSKHNLSHGSELTKHTESTGKLSSCSELSSPQSSPRGREMGELPLPFHEKVTRKSSTGNSGGAKPNIIEEISLLSMDNRKPRGK